MEVNIPMSVWSPTQGEVVFNDLSGNATSISGIAGAVYPSGLPSGNGYLMTVITGADGASVRNPFSARPHKHGGIVHVFKRTFKTIALEGMVVATSPANRQLLTDQLRSVLLEILSPGIFGQPNDVFGRYFWKPAANPADLSNPRYKTRFHKCYLYSMYDVVGPAAQEGQSPVGVAGPKTYSFELVSEHPEALTWAGDETDFDGFGAGTVPNDGNTETWPVVRVNLSSGSFTLFGPAGEIMLWGQGPDPSQNPSPVQGSYIEIDMQRETMYWDSNGPDALAGLDMTYSDFFPIPVGGGTVSALGADSIQVFSNSAWVG